MKIGFIGLGLIGGSIARAVRYFYPDTEIIAHSRTRASVEQAVADGVINRVIDQIDEDFSDCTYIFLCAPVSSNASDRTGLHHHRCRQHQDRYPRKGNRS